jgi:hypothetical protein
MFLSSDSSNIQKSNFKEWPFTWVAILIVFLPCHIIIIKLLTWFTNLFQSYEITMFSRYHKFHKNLKSFKSFIEYIHIF